MKTGIELIAEERREQIEKFGYSVKSDAFNYKDHDGALVRAACAIAYDSEDDKPAQFSAPDWAWEIREQKQTNHITGAERIERLKVAGALIAAEIDRLNAIESVAP